MDPVDDIPERFDERSVLLQMLHYAQDQAVRTILGLSQDLARQAPLPTSPVMSPVNVLNHLRWVERSWIDHDLLGGADDAPWSAHDPDAEFAEGSTLPLEEVIELYRAQGVRTRAVFAEIDFDAPMAGDRFDEPLTARWLLLHLIEETSRHNGHLDVLRELADGATGI